MRDLPRLKFERAVTGMGFARVLTATSDGLFYVACDGLRVSPILHPGTVRVDRRKTLARMARARRRRPYSPAKSEATGAATPVASSVTTP